MPAHTGSPLQPGGRVNKEKTSSSAVTGSTPVPLNIARVV